MPCAGLALAAESRASRRRHPGARGSRVAREARRAPAKRAYRRRTEQRLPLRCLSLGRRGSAAGGRAARAGGLPCCAPVQGACPRSFLRMARRLRAPPALPCTGRCRRRPRRPPRRLGTHDRVPRTDRSRSYIRRRDSHAWEIQDDRHTKPAPGSCKRAGPFGPAARRSAEAIGVIDRGEQGAAPKPPTLPPADDAAKRPAGPGHSRNRWPSCHPIFTNGARRGLRPITSTTCSMRRTCAQATRRTRITVDATRRTRRRRSRTPRPVSRTGSDPPADPGEAKACPDRCGVTSPGPVPVPVELAANRLDRARCASITAGPRRRREPNATDDATDDATDGPDGIGSSDLAAERGYRASWPMSASPVRPPPRYQRRLHRLHSWSY